MTKRTEKQPRRIVRVTYDSDTLGSGKFWEGEVDRTTKLDNIVADKLAKLTARDGRPRKAGMWQSEVVEEI